MVRLLTMALGMDSTQIVESMISPQKKLHENGVNGDGDAVAVEEENYE